MVDISIINAVLKKFLTAPRHPKYLDKTEYKHLEERNKEIYMSSAWFKKHWSWNHVKSYCTSMINPEKQYFICGLPYQLAIKENLLMKEAVADEMSEENFNSITWLMEMGCEFWGESEDAFFSFDELLKSRTVKNIMYPNYILNSIQSLKYKNPEKNNGEIRLVCGDIAAMGSQKRKNDATSIHVLQLLPTSDGQYTRNLVYTENMDGGHSETQALLIRKIYDELNCDYIVLDTNGVGLGIYDYLVTDITDPDTGIMYKGLSCFNDETMAIRYKGSSMKPDKVIYSVKANAQFNSNAAFRLKDDIKRGKLRLPIVEFDADSYLKEAKIITKSLETDDKTTILLPYINTTLLINEIVNLEYEIIGNMIKVKNKSTLRKDRYSSLSYGNYFATELEHTLYKQKKENNSTANIFNFKAPILRRN